MALILAAVGLLSIQFLTERLVAPATTGSSSAPHARMTDEERAFVEYMEPRLLTAAAESRRLTELGRQRSRNVLELQTRGNRVEEVAEEIDAFVLAYGVPPRFSEAHESYAEGVAVVRTGMKEARSGVMAFDFDRVAAAVDQFEAGTAALERSVGQLQDKGVGQPATSSPVGVEQTLLVSTV